jgi:hypothetical protein
MTPDASITLPDATRRHLRTAFQQALVILRKYHDLMRASPVYIAIIVLYPSFNWWYFEKNWLSGRLRGHFNEIKSLVRAFWQSEYNSNV